MAKTVNFKIQLEVDGKDKLVEAMADMKMEWENTLR